MKIIQINAVYEYSSTGRTTKEIHECLCAQGIDSYVATKNVKTGGKFIKVGCNVDYYIHSLGSHLLGLQGFFSIISTLFLVRRLKKINPDIVHLRNLHSNYINLPLLFRYLHKSQKPVIVTLHDFWLLTGHCCYFNDSNCYRWKECCGNCPDKKKWNSSWIFDTSKRSLKRKRNYLAGIERLAVIGVSQWVTSFIDESIARNAYIKRTIYNWIDTDLFKPTESDLRQELGIAVDSFVILGVSQQWTYEKGLRDFLSLAQTIREAKIVLVGKWVMKDVELPSNIILAGEISNVKKLVQYYSMANVFFNPTTRETFGKVTVEAQACGTPVIAYNATATPELIAEGCGAVVERSSISTVAKVCHEMMEKGKDYYSANCRNNVIANFNKKTIVKEYVDLYMKMLDR